MHILQMVLLGLILLALFVGIAKFFPRPSWTITRAATVFMPVWAIVSIGNMLTGIFMAGIPFWTELWVLGIIFGVPTAAAWFLRRAITS